MCGLQRDNTYCDPPAAIQAGVLVKYMQSKGSPASKRFWGGTSAGKEVVYLKSNIDLNLDAATDASADVEDGWETGECVQEAAVQQPVQGGLLKGIGGVQAVQGAEGLPVLSGVALPL